MSANLETGFFVKQPAWHNEGTVLDDVPSTDEAYKISGLNWKVEKKRLSMENNGIYIPTEHFAIVRDSDNSVLGYTGKNYTTYQNKQAFDWCKPLVESDLWQWETAGSLCNGEICWGLLKQGDYNIIKGDDIKEYLLVCWSHDGKKANIVQPTSIRVVCQNTLNMSLKSHDYSRVRHNTNVVMKMEELKEFYNLTKELFDKQQEELKRLLDKKLTDIKIEEYIDSLYPIAEKGKSHTITKRNNEFVKSMAFGKASGINELGIKNTAYSAFMAVSEANEHYLGGNRIKDRGQNILFGKGLRDNIDAYNLAKAI